MKSKKERNKESTPLILIEKGVYLLILANFNKIIINKDFQLNLIFTFKSLNVFQLFY